MNNTALIQKFKQQAEAVSSQVRFCSGLQQGLEYVLKVCLQKESSSDNFGPKVIAAPDLAPAELQELKNLCSAHPISLLSKNLFTHLSRLDIGLTRVEYAIAETGTLVLNSKSEDKRLASMISEIHINLVPESRIHASSQDLEPRLQNNFSSGPDYTSFITGASRTADIERVLTLGVHGPLELHILILQDR